MEKILPSFHKIEEGEKVALVDPSSKVCLKVSQRIADNLENQEVQEAIYPIWEQQVCFNKQFAEAHERINTVYLMVTRKCNMNCEFCAISANDKIQLDQEIQLEDIETRVVPFFQKYKPHKLIITGGEPLIKKKIVEIVRVLSQGISCPIILQSNGVAVNPFLINSLRDYISEIEFSTKHMFESKGKVKELIEHIDLCQKNNIKVVLSFIYEKNKLQDLYRMIDIAADYDLDLVFNVISPMGRAKENSYILTEVEQIDMNLKIAEYILRRGYESKKMCNGLFRRIQIRDSCGGYGHIMAVFPEGNIYMCQCMENDEVCMGNIISDAPERIIDNWEKLLQSQRIKQKFCVDDKEVCRKCNYRYVCGGKCTATESNVNNNRCIFRKAMLNYMLFHYNSKADKISNIRDYIKYMVKIKEQIENIYSTLEY